MAFQELQAQITDLKEPGSERAPPVGLNGP